MAELRAANDAGDQTLIDALTQARAHYQAGHAAAAEQGYRQILETHPNQPEALHLLGYLAYQAGRHEAAIELIGRAVAFGDEAAAPRNDLALALWASGRPEAAAQCCRAALALKPGFPEAWLNLGNARKDQGEPGGAIQCYRRTLALDRRRVEAWNQMAITWIEEARFDLAESACLSVLSLRPTMAEAHYNRALALLVRGRWGEAWPEFEWRLRVKAMAKTRADIAGRRWEGGSWSGDRAEAPVVLVHGEQGLGDSIMFCRFAPLVVARGWQVVLAVQPEIVGLLAEGLDSEELTVGVIPNAAEGIDVALPPYDSQVSLMSLPALFATEPATIPHEPYLRADPKRRQRWRARIHEAAPSGIRVGLVWAGNPRRGNTAGAAVDRRRSLSLSLLAPLGGIEGAHFFALQKGKAGLEALQPPPALGLVDLAPEIRDFRDSAAIIAELDLLISVDTAAAHLAGALGCKVWLLNRFDTDWRWLWERSDSPWYPSLTIYRQPRRGDWQATIQRVSVDLERLAREPGGLSAHPGV
ncbi:MAG: tetratricopeptide repeat protein [Proteobacteria bacterium]|nr:tetratricopeptide repeat protein [Pseudomonadota bacterium]MBI3497565.1 tetratricopeptide repeat protein [Pseudomonadota bacterium]